MTEEHDMTSAQLPFDASSISNTIGISVIERALKRLEAMLDGAAERVCEDSDFAELREELDKLRDENKELKQRVEKIEALRQERAIEDEG